MSSIFCLQVRNNAGRDYRKMDVSEIFNVFEALKNPWEELERQFSRTRCDIEKTIDIDSSVEIISRNTIECSSSMGNEESNFNTINISSSMEKNQESQNSSVDLKIDTINFNSNSQESDVSSSKSVIQLDSTNEDSNSVE